MAIQEIKTKFNSIVQFSELGNFIDAPIHTYSTGMLLRLGFSIAVHVDFEVLLLDEILLVGDLYFQNKCYNKIEEFKKQGKTIVISSQALSLVKSLTDKVLLLDKGKVVAFSSPEQVIKIYENFKQNVNPPATCNIPLIIKEKKEKEDPVNVKRDWATKSGTKEAEIESVKLLNRWKIPKNKFKSGETLLVKVNYRVDREIQNPYFGVAIFREDYLYCYGPNTKFDAINTDTLKPGRGRFTIRYPNLLLAPGTYYISVAIWNKDETVAYDYHCAFYKLKVYGKHTQYVYSENYRCTSMPNNGGKGDSYNNASIMMYNKHFEKSGVFKTGDVMHIVFDHNSAENIKTDAPIGIYREDGVLCFELKTKIPRRNSHTRYINQFVIPNLHLLMGNYNIISEHSRLGGFYVLSEKKDHGLVYLPHTWDIKFPVLS